jgi:hypothetical protein
VLHVQAGSLPLVLLPKPQRVPEQENISPRGRMLPELSWVADLLCLVERIRSAPGPPGHSNAEGDTACLPNGSLLLDGINAL